MSIKTPYRALFTLSSLLTDLFPGMGARLIDRLVAALFGNRLLIQSGLKKNLRNLARVREFRRIMVIADLNIGDAVTLQSAITALRDFLPEAEIEYAVNRFARPLIEGNPEISRVWPIFTGTYFPDKNDFRRIGEIAAGRTYDLVLNFCPLFREDKLRGVNRNTIGYAALASQLIRDEQRPGTVNHIVYKTYRYVHDMLSSFRTPQRNRQFRGVSVTLQDSAVKRAEDFLAAADVPAGTPIVFYNPDASSPFTRIPFERQRVLLDGIAAMNVTVLVGAGHTARDIGSELVAGLSPLLRRRAVIVPSLMPLDAYTALIDLCDIYVTADTGPLHLAAARKISRDGGHIFRNRTSVFSIFGATPATLYGYDSLKPGFFAANQDAASACYDAQSRCRNITCINKMAKTCRDIRCFEQLDVNAILEDIQNVLGGNGAANHSHRGAIGSIPLKRIFP